VLIHGAAGNVGAYAVQLAARAGADIVATAHADDLETVRALGAGRVLDARASRFEDTVAGVDVVIDTVGGETQTRSFGVLAPGGILVSSAAPPDQALAAARGVRALFFLVEVTIEGLTRLAGLLDAGQLRAAVGDVLPLAEARRAHEMLAGAPHKAGKIVLAVAKN
jgi:NADPH:quinone reductase-like Zn-dependent oxidoreductase